MRVILARILSPVGLWRYNWLSCFLGGKNTIMVFLDACSDTPMKGSPYKPPVPLLSGHSNYTSTHQHCHQHQPTHLTLALAISPSCPKQTLPSPPSSASTSDAIAPSPKTPLPEYMPCKQHCLTTSSSMWRKQRWLYVYTKTIHQNISTRKFVTPSTASWTAALAKLL
jgi:hypothetical protein